MGILETVLVCSVVLLALVVIWTVREGGNVLSFLVGASAALVGVQFLRIHLFSLVVVVWLLYRCGSFNGRNLLRASVVILAAGLLASTALLGDLVNSPTLALQLLALAASAAAVMTVSSAQDRRHIVLGLLSMITLSSFFAVLQVLKIIPMEMWHLSISSVGRPVGIYPEPDWLGMFAGIGLVVAWRMDLSKWVRVAAVLLNVAAFVLAFARAAWVAVAVSILAVLVLSAIGRRWTRKVRGRGTAAVLVAVLGATVFFASPQLVADLSGRLGNTLSVGEDDVSGQARVRQIAALLVLAENAPPYGHGLSASGKVTVWGEIDLGQSENNVASNWILAMWVDGRWLAVPLIALLLFVAVKSSRTIPGQALVIVLASSFFSNATYFPVMWLLLAISFGGGVPLRGVEARQPNELSFSGTLSDGNGNKFFVPTVVSVRRGSPLEHDRMP